MVANVYKSGLQIRHLEKLSSGEKLKILGKNSRTQETSSRVRQNQYYLRHIEIRAWKIWRKFCSSGRIFVQQIHPDLIRWKLPEEFVHPSFTNVTLMWLASNYQATLEKNRAWKYLPEDQRGCQVRRICALIVLFSKKHFDNLHGCWFFSVKMKF